MTRSPRRGVDARTPSALGRAGEALAARFLERRGYRIIGRNVRADRVEIDLIARRGSLLVFVEVKCRRSTRQGSAAAAVDAAKQRRLRRGAAAWLALEPAHRRRARHLRFDVVTCLLDAAAGTEGPSDDDGRRQADTVASDGTRWRIEHWEDAF